MKKVHGFNLKPGFTLTPGDYVTVYYNIQKGGFSIMKAGKVIAHSEYVTLTNCTFNVNLKKLNQVRANNRKAVCAVVRGNFLHTEHMDTEHMQPVYFNPYHTDLFETHGKPVQNASLVHFAGKLSYIKGEK